MSWLFCYEKYDHYTFENAGSTNSLETFHVCYEGNREFILSPAVIFGFQWSEFTCGSYAREAFEDNRLVN